MDLLVRRIEVLVGNPVYLLAGEFPAALLALVRCARAALAEALEFANVGAGDLRHMAKLLVGELSAAGTEGVEQRPRAVECHGCRFGLCVWQHRVLVVPLQNHVLHLEAGFRYEAEHTGVEAAREALIHAEVLRRAVRRDGDLLVVADELVHEREEVLDALRLADDVLDVVDDEHVGVVVFAQDDARAVLRDGELADVILDICLRVRVLHAQVRAVLVEIILDREQQVRLAEAAFTVDEERRAGAGFVGHGGEANGGLIGVLVFIAVHEVLEREFRVHVYRLLLLFGGIRCVFLPLLGNFGRFLLACMDG